MADENKIRDAADAVKGLVDAVPVYDDALKPAMKEVGIGLQTIAKTIHIALAPVSALVWGYDQIKEFISSRVAEKLKDTPPEEITEPEVNVAGPALEALRYTGHKSELRELYANLLATSMDSLTASLAHPSFVEAIKQMSPDEAKLMQLFAQERYFPFLSIQSFEKTTGHYIHAMRYVSRFAFEAGCEHGELLPSYLDNLSRLGLIKVPENRAYTDASVYESLENHPIVLDKLQQINSVEGRRGKIQRQAIVVTDLGRNFINACIIEHSDLRTDQSKPKAKTESPLDQTEKNTG